MQRVQYDHRFLDEWVQAHVVSHMAVDAAKAEQRLIDRTGPGKDFLGWLTLPETSDRDTLGGIQKKAEQIRNNTDVLIAIGIGGSYLGARAAIEFLSTTFDDRRSPRILYAGHHVNSDYLQDLIDLIQDKLSHHPNLLKIVILKRYFQFA